MIDNTGVRIQVIDIIAKEEDRGALKEDQENIEAILLEEIMIIQEDVEEEC